MATVPQRELRNNTAALLRRVEEGERLTITVHGHPVAELGPIERRQRFVPKEQIVASLAGLLEPDDPLEEEIRERESEGGLGSEDPFERWG